MPEFENMEQAAQALAEASQVDAASRAEETNAGAPPATSETPASPTPGADAGATETTDSFTNIDPTTLPPELQAIYKSMQGDYTRSKQELSPYKEYAEKGVDLERASQALEFIEALETDPQFLVSVHERLSAAMEQMGMTPAQAAQAATQQLQSATDGDPFGLGTEDDGVSELKQELNELKEWRQAQEAAEAERYLAAQLQSAEMAIRQAHPDYTDDDMSSIFQLAFAHGGDLAAAEKSYAALRDRFVSSYVEGKASAAAGAPPVVEGGAAAQTPPEGFGMDLEAAHRAAVGHLTQILANE